MPPPMAGGHWKEFRRMVRTSIRAALCPHVSTLVRSSTGWAEQIPAEADVRKIANAIQYQVLIVSGWRANSYHSVSRHFVNVCGPFEVQEAADPSSFYLFASHGSDVGQ